MKQLHSNDFSRMNKTIAENFSKDGLDTELDLKKSSYALAHPDPLNNDQNSGITRQVYDSALK